MKKLIILPLLMLVVCFMLMPCEETNAQQDAMYTQYMFNHLQINPAYSGSRETLSGTAFYRNQWTGFEGAPQTYSIGIHSPAFKRVGLGATFEGDVIGPMKNYNLSLNYAYLIPIKNGVLSAGLRGSVMSYNANFLEAETVQENDVVFQENVNRILPNFGAGLYYHSENLVLGVGVPRLLDNKLNDDGENTINKASKLERHYYATAGVVLKLSNNFKLRPSALVKYLPTAPIEFDLGANIIYKEMIWLGGAYRTGASWNLNVMYQLSREIRLGYAFDFTTTQLNQYSTGTHEIMIGYDLIKTGKIVSPRYF